MKYGRQGACELCPSKATVFDHCHMHGWIRGELCRSHNGRMQLIDGGRRRELWEPWVVAHWRRCPDCAFTEPTFAEDVPPPAQEPEPTPIEDLPPVEWDDHEELLNGVMWSWRLARRWRSPVFWSPLP